MLFLLFDDFNVLLVLNDFSRHFHVLNVDSGACLIHGIDCFVRKKTVRNISGRKIHARQNSIISICYIVVIFVFVFNLVRISTVSSTEVGSTITFWNRLSRAPSFSMY